MKTTTIHCVHCDDDVDAHLSAGTYNGHPLCERCYSHEFCTCENCGEICLLDDTEYVESDGRRVSRSREGSYCPSCFEALFVRCASCESVIENTGNFRRRHDGENYCYPCFEDQFYECDECGEAIHRDYIHSDDSRDGCFCEHCFRQSEEESLIHDYSYKPKTLFYGVGGVSQYLESPSTFYAGIELEVECNGNFEIVGNIQRDWLYVKRDGSLSSGFEVVTHPLSWDWLKAHSGEIGKLLWELRRACCKSYDTTTCGIHIHIPKSFHTSFETYCLLRFLYNNKREIVAISQRKASALARWARLGCDSGSDERQDALKKAKDKYTPERYEALNLQNSRTAEFRIFRGTLHDASFWKNLEFVHALSHFVKGRKPSEMKWANFKTYVSKQDYPHLNAFIERRAL